MEPAVARPWMTPELQWLDGPLSDRSLVVMAKHAGGWTMMVAAMLASACSAPTPAPTSPSAAAAPVSDSSSDPLESEKARVLSMRAPRYSGSGDKDDALHFVNSELKAWIGERKRATEAVVQRYLERAAGDAATEQAAASFRSVAQLELDVAREFVAGGMSAMPKSFAADAELARAYRSALVDAAGAQLAAARKAAESCVQRAPAGAPVARDCEQLNREVAAEQSP